MLRIMKTEPKSIETMKNVKKILILLVALAISFTMNTGILAQVKFQNMDLAKAKAKAAKEDKLVFVDVYASWCGPCKELDRFVFSRADVASILNQKFIPLKIDGEDETRIEDLITLNVEAYPSLFIINPKTDEITKFQGFMDADDLLEELDFALNPKKHPVKIVQQTLKENATKDNYMNVISALLADRSENQEQIDETVALYIEKFPNLDLTNSIDQLIFSRHINDTDHPLVTQFLSDQKGFDNDFRETKFLSILEHYLNQAIEKENVGIVNEKYHRLLPYFEDLFDSKEDKDELFQKIQEIYKASI